MNLILVSLLVNCILLVTDIGNNMKTFKECLEQAMKQEDKNVTVACIKERNNILDAYDDRLSLALMINKNSRRIK